MADLIKNRYNHMSLGQLASDIHSVHQPFQADEFLKATINEKWDDLELKDRVYCISLNLGKYLPPDYEAAIGVIDKVVMNYGSWLEGFGSFFPVFVELYGQDIVNWDISMGALARYTRYASSEIAVRPFIINHEERMMVQMYAWSKHEDECIRRLASEGCRPALPWAPALTSFKKDPSPVLPILEQLKTDPSLHVRKSVANNLNDISKTHPELIANLAKSWYGKSQYTDWIVKHGCRTLLKKGNREVLSIFGYNDLTTVDVEHFALDVSAISIGDDITISFVIHAGETTKVRLEYGIDYVKASGKQSRKIFQISEITLKANQQKAYRKKHSFENVSIRKHYPGIHAIALIVNGTERGKLDVLLTN